MDDQHFTGSFKAFYSDGYKIGMQAVNNGLTKESIVEAAKQIYENIDQLTDAFLKLAQQENTTVFCKKGCWWCCYQPVYALSHEVIYLKEFVANNFSNEEQKKIQAKAKEKDAKLEGVNQEALLNSKHACPLLKEGSCSAYKARPMACRIYLSLNLKSCQDFYEEPNTTANYPKIMHFPLQAGRMMNEGFKAALKQNGYFITEFRIEEGLLNDASLQST